MMKMKKHQSKMWKLKTWKKVAFNWEVVNEEVELRGNMLEKEYEDGDSGFGEKFYDLVDDERLNDEDVVAQVDPAPPISALVAQRSHEDDGPGVDTS
ncbi:hypothetical protein Dimus_024875, partial [Dionaea muscipula]